MSKHGTFHRYMLLVECISQNKFPSFRALSEFLGKAGFQVGDRTIQRDIEQLRNEFGIEVSFDAAKRGYFIDADKSFRPETFLKFLQIVTTGQLLSETLKDTKESLHYISFGSPVFFKGLEVLPTLIRAIKGTLKVHFSHVNYHTNIARDYVFYPHLLREFQSRWYVVGLIEGMQEFRTFGIDRIHSVQLKNEQYTMQYAPQEVEQLFDHTFGVVYSEGNIETVKLALSPIQGKYVQALPLHPSQQVIAETDAEILVALAVIPNYELKHQILQLGVGCKVIEPLWLAEEIKALLQEMLAQYTH